MPGWLGALAPWGTWVSAHIKTLRHQQMVAIANGRHDTSADDLRTIPVGCADVAQSIVAFCKRDTCGS